jgi:DNA-binding transcriptional regulator LsrR (DeoR family)
VAETRRAAALADASPDAARDLAIRAAWHYHVEGLTQAEVAHALGLSRAKVLRLLAFAEAQGIVEVQVVAPGSERVALERSLAARYGLAEVVVVPATGSAGTPRAVGDAAAAWLARTLRPGMTVGIGWGQTLDHAVRSLAPAASAGLGATVVSLLGGMPRSHGINPTQVARQLADALGGDCCLLAAPLVVADAATRAALWNEPSLAALRARAQGCDVALMSVGDVAADATLFREHLLPRAALEGLRAAGAVGDLLGHFLDRDGREVVHEVNHRVMAVALADLARVPRLALASGGARKVAALRAALAALPVSVLVTDEAAATGLAGEEGAAW